MFLRSPISYIQTLSKLASPNQPRNPCSTPPNSPQRASASKTTSTLPTMSSTSSSHTTTQSSCPSYNSLGYSSCPLFQEKASPFPSRHHTRSLLSTTSFTHTASTHLTFSAFPPLLVNLTASALSPAESSQQTALTLLLEPHSYLTLQPGVVAAGSIVQSCFSVAQSPELDAAIASFEFLSPGSASRNHPSLWSCGSWSYYTVTGSILATETSGTFGTFGARKSAAQIYQIALRTLPNGVESVTLSSDGSVCMRGTMRVEERVPYSDWEEEKTADYETNMEALWLVEELEVRCQSFLGWRMQRKIVERSEGVHERFRERWDRETRRRVQGGGK